ncbi:MAG: tRNA pseudouridine(38-40) synthase TruA [Leptospirales bacterium]|nr:tRNA pseudouridine(38-40) synthase TruA [Leptospirales bacterium]
MEPAACRGSTVSRRRIALLLQYDGTAFNGWQLQKDGRTVQGELEKAITVLTGETLRVTASGRTDSGVHALGQVAHFDMAGSHSLERLCAGLNGIIQPDVSVRNAYETDALFHSRFSAFEREYLYLIHNYPQRDPFARYRAMWFNRRLDDFYLAETLRYIEGEHDFASFCKKKSRLENTVRKILKTSAKKRGNYIFISIRGNAFLHNMVRIIVGTCIQMFLNGDEPSHIIEILNGKNRDLSGNTVPPHGLYLKEIKFNPELAKYPCAFDF